MKQQKIWWGIDLINELQQALEKDNVKTIMLVCGSSYEKMKDRIGIENFPVKIVRFSDFSPNPEYQSVEKGIQRFIENDCEAIVAIGGGSALDVAKCIKLYARQPEEWKRFSKHIEANDIKLYAVPTTAGTGSEATSFAVIYKNGVKYSIQDDSLIYDGVLFDEKLLDTLPLYQKKATVLDALSHAVESYWSVNSDECSRTYAREAMDIILKNMWTYIKETENVSVNKELLLAANKAGMAINISKTTAGHALSYKMSSLYNIAHGHAAALCVEGVWRYMIKHLEDCVDGRGEEHVRKSLEQLAICFGAQRIEEGPDCFRKILQRMDMLMQFEDKEKLCHVLVESVNVERLKNTPVFLDKTALYDIIWDIMGMDEEKMLF